MNKNSCAVARIQGATYMCRKKTGAKAAILKVLPRHNILTQSKFVIFIMGKYRLL